MKKLLATITLLFAFAAIPFAQEKKPKEKLAVPPAVKTALAKKYPEASKVTWEKEKGNYEANWGGKSGEDHSVQFTPSGDFVEVVDAIPVSELPKSIVDYVASHYKGVKITEAGKLTNAAGVHFYEAEVKGKDLVFDINGKYQGKD